MNKLAAEYCPQPLDAAIKVGLLSSLLQKKMQTTKGLLFPQLTKLMILARENSFWTCTFSLGHCSLPQELPFK
jgi:NADH:ubiquinone oxidoreductase subunit B-like Fe-S oxidoreductase